VQQDHIVEIRDVSFGYDAARPVLRDIDLAIPRGAVVGIMGQSGCGKTTLLRMIMGALRPSAGSVRVLGRATAELDRGSLYGMRREMGMLFQFGALFTDLSVYENVAFPLREHTDLPDEMLHDLVLLKLEAVGLRGAAHLLYDEPFTALDPISFGVISRLIRDLNGSLGATSIIVTHDVQEALGVVDYVYFMAAGRIIAQGTPDEIRSNHEPFVNQFVNGKRDGPVPFHYPALDYAADLESAQA
jgi:phospholipid/cholesterol/gamma-HCH transport system ATP-binding protein